MSEQLPLCTCAAGACHINDSQGAYVAAPGCLSVIWYDKGTQQVQCRALLAAVVREPPQKPA